MKAVLFAAALPLIFAASGSHAMPLPAAPIAPLPIEQVQMRCDQNSCIDQRSGVYTESACDRRGCYPSSSPRGRVGGYGGYGGYGQDERPYRGRRGYDDDGGGYRGRGGYDGYDGGYRLGR